ncbi:MAG: hypothetical protein MUF84_06965 [Anaerolineae bacterium]|jgi:hypothetical protein|nr:hypothetical protein [Anaerolineae bacterium]
MQDTEKVACIVTGMELYFRTFGLADGIDLHTGDVEWIIPWRGRTGPAVVFRVSLDEQSVDARIEGLVSGMNAGEVPALWVISPTSTPASLVDRLLARGFRNLSDAAHAEPGMALGLSEPLCGQSGPGPRGLSPAQPGRLVCLGYRG